MSLKDVFQEALNEWEWEDEIEHDDSNNTDIIRTSYGINDKTYSFVMWTDEDRQWIRISVKSPLSIPEARRGDGALLLNFFNSGMPIGNLTMGIEDGYIYYSNCVDIEGAEAVPTIFSNIRSAADNAFNAFNGARFNALAALTYTKQKLASIIEEFEEAMDAPSEDAPDEL